MAKEKISEYERFMALTDAEKDAEVAIYDQFPAGFPGGKPLRKSDKALHRLARARGHAVAAGKVPPADRVASAGPVSIGPGRWWARARRLFRSASNAACSNKPTCTQNSTSSNGRRWLPKGFGW